MKRQWVLAMALMATTLGGATYGWADGTNCCQHRKSASPGERMAPGHKLGCMTKQLGLSDDQQANIGKIFEEERKKCAPLMQKLAENRKLLRQAEQTAKFE